MPRQRSWISGAIKAVRGWTEPVSVSLSAQSVIQAGDWLVKVSMETTISADLRLRIASDQRGGGHVWRYAALPAPLARSRSDRADLGQVQCQPSKGHYGHNPCNRSGCPATLRPDEPRRYIKCAGNLTQSQSGVAPWQRAAGHITKPISSGRRPVQFPKLVTAQCRPPTSH